MNRSEFNKSKLDVMKCYGLTNDMHYIEDTADPDEEVDYIEEFWRQHFETVRRVTGLNPYEA